MEKIENEKKLKEYQTFEEMNLQDNLLKGIYNYGFRKPSKIQKKAIVPILSKKDIIIQSQSGSGKTGVFSISSLQLVDKKIKQTQVLILSNTRELAEQTEKVIKSIGEYMNIKIHLCIGGRSIQEDQRVLEEGAQIISGTPGRIYDMILRKSLKTKSIKLLILDEADEMLSRGFKNQIYEIYRCLPDVQVLLVSATFPKHVLEITELFMKDPIKLLVERDNITVESIRQFFIHVEKDKWKFETLCDLYDSFTMSQTVIFCNTKKRVEWLVSKMRENNFAVCCIHSDLMQKEREVIMKEFRNGNFRVLISTGIIGRGLDIQQVRLVINFDLPNSREEYIHRIGRSGRFGRKSVAINFVLDQEMMVLRDIEQFYSTQIDEMPSDINNFF